MVHLENFKATVALIKALMLHRRKDTHNTPTTKQNCWQVLEPRRGRMMRRYGKYTLGIKTLPRGRGGRGLDRSVKRTLLWPLQGDERRDPAPHAAPHDDHLLVPLRQQLIDQGDRVLLPP